MYPSYRDMKTAFGSELENLSHGYFVKKATKVGLGMLAQRLVEYAKTIALTTI
jgi:hypothetical protein